MTLPSSLRTGSLTISPERQRHRAGKLSLGEMLCIMVPFLSTACNETSSISGFMASHRNLGTALEASPVMAGFWA